MILLQNNGRNMYIRGKLSCLKVSTISLSSNYTLNASYATYVHQLGLLSCFCKCLYFTKRWFVAFMKTIAFFIEVSNQKKRISPYS